MKKRSQRIPRIKEDVSVMVARMDLALKERLTKVVGFLKTSDQKYKWSQNAVIIESLERFIEDIEKEM